MGNSEELPPDNGMIDGTRDKFSTPVLVNPDIFLFKIDRILECELQPVSFFRENFPTTF